MAKKSKPSSNSLSCGPDPKWAAEDDARTLERAAEINNDPARVKAAAAVMKEKAKATNDVVADLAKRGLISDKAKAKIAKKG